MAGDPAYLAWVRSLPCVSCGRPPRSEAHHVTMGRGLGQKAPDDQAVPLCPRCHCCFHDGAGRFWDLGHAARTALQTAWLAATRANWDNLSDDAAF